MKGTFSAKLTLITVAYQPNSVGQISDGISTRNYAPFVELDGSLRGPLAGCCECGDEPSGSGATELVSYTVHYCTDKSQPVATILTQMVYSTQSHPSSSRSILILYSHLAEVSSS
jgi:hypothetical protein